jgi:hypothetical protein
MKIDLSKAIKAINSSAEFCYAEEDINTIEWLNGTTPIAKQTILNKQTELQAEYESTQYQRDRAKAYPSIQEQLDLQYWDKINNTDTWEQAINAVKAQYPKS